jgi:hypothetical protein
MNTPHFAILLDRSESMDILAGETIAGFNGFLAHQKVANPKAAISQTQFDHRYESVYVAQPFAEAPYLSKATYRPRGMTALWDAIGRTITDLADSLKKSGNADPKVLVCILTDGFENSSTEYTLERLKTLIEHMSKAHGWLFMLLGANQNAQKTGQGLGILPKYCVSTKATTEGTAAAFSVVNEAFSEFSRSGSLQALALQDSYSITLSKHQKPSKKR